MLIYVNVLYSPAHLPDPNGCHLSWEAKDPLILRKGHLVLGMYHHHCPGGLPEVVHVLVLANVQEHLQTWNRYVAWLFLFDWILLIFLTRIVDVETGKFVEV